MNDQLNCMSYDDVLNTIVYLLRQNKAEQSAPSIRNEDTVNRSNFHHGPDGHREEEKKKMNRCCAWVR